MSRPKIWSWSREAVKNFMAAASQGRGRFHVPSGLDAALATELEGITPAFAKLWVDILGSEAFKPRTLTLRLGEHQRENFSVTIAENGVVTGVEVRVPLTKAFLLDLMLLNHPDAQETTPPGETQHGEAQDQGPATAEPQPPEGGTD